MFTSTKLKGDQLIACAYTSIHLDIYNRMLYAFHKATPPEPSMKCHATYIITGSPNPVPLKTNGEAMEIDEVEPIKIDKVHEGEAVQILCELVQEESLEGRSNTSAQKNYIANNGCLRIQKEV